MSDAVILAEKAKKYLESQGITAPDFVIDAWAETATSIQSCLDENYSESIALMIQLYLIGMFGLASMDKYISSQTAPSGASQSFRYQSFADRWRSQLSLLRSADKHGCTVGLVPPDPTTTAAGFWVATGNKMCGGGK